MTVRRSAAESRTHSFSSAGGPDIFVCGHSHILKVIFDKKYNMLTVNPGAAGIQGFHQVRTAIRVHIDDGDIHGMEIGEWPRFVK